MTGWRSPDTNKKLPKGNVDASKRSVEQAHRKTLSADSDNLDQCILPWCHKCQCFVIDVDTRDVKASLRGDLAGEPSGAASNIQ